MVPRRLLALVPMAFGWCLPALGSPQITLQESFQYFSRPIPDRAGQPSFPTAGHRALTGFQSLGTMAIPARETGFQIACGPAASSHTLECIDLKSGSIVTQIPIPGDLGATPMFHNDAWLIATSEGIVLRARIGSSTTPAWPATISSNFWGTGARKTIQKIRQGDPNIIQQLISGDRSWTWIQSTGSRLIGSPQLHDNIMFAISANNYLHAFDLRTGKVQWTSRLGRDLALRLESNSIALAEGGHQLVLGADDGVILGLKSDSGQPVWQHRLTSLGTARFNTVVAPALIFDRSMVASTADTVTERVRLDGCFSSKGCPVLWSVPTGSTVTALALAGQVVIGGRNGTLWIVNADTGAVAHRIPIFPDTTIAALSAIRAPESAAEANQNTQSFILAVSALGEIIVIDPTTGEASLPTPALGSVRGDFFPGRNSGEQCLSFAMPGFRCFVLRNEPRFRGHRWRNISQ